MNKQLSRTYLISLHLSSPASSFSFSKLIHVLLDATCVACYKIKFQGFYTEPFEAFHDML